jgi:hypothetical protein
MKGPGKRMRSIRWYIAEFIIILVALALIFYFMGVDMIIGFFAELIISTGIIFLIKFSVDRKRQKR